MNYLLDTNIIIDHLRKKARLEEKIEQEHLAISNISYAKLIYGALKSNNKNAAFKIVNDFLTDFSLSGNSCAKDEAKNLKILIFLSLQQQWFIPILW